MSTSSSVPLGALRLMAQQRSDMVNNPAISTPEWNNYLNSRYKALYDLLIACYGNDYYVADLYQFTTTASQTYPLPDGTPTYQNVSGTTAQKFYKLLGVDLQYSASPSGWVSLRRFEMIERNKYANPNTAVNWNGYSNLRYRTSGNNLYLVPIPQNGQTIRLWYAPAPTNIQFMLSCGTNLTSSSISLADTTGLSSGMQVQGTGIQTNTTVLSVASTSVLLSKTPSATNTSAILSFWNDSTLIEGISGWEEYVVLGAAIKAQIKQENDYSGLAAEFDEITQRIEAMAEGRDAGQAQHVSDAMALNGPGYGINGNDDGWGSW